MVSLLILCKGYEGEESSSVYFGDVDNSTTENDIICFGTSPEALLVGVRWRDTVNAG